ncbi:MAG: hypothetical protein COZ95_00600 [Nitrospirae bacterium CG_4_8_14_3_um_filter_50_41]|nr:MAG: hypothetical protein COZ95_00600 [Nitrospirae bacterium CG_4_8_14_3_um_filter_50_41]
MARRKTLIDRLRSDNTLLLDSGDIFFGSFPPLIGSRTFYGYKASAMVRAMSLMGYDAAIPGDYDFAQGDAFLLDRIREASFPFVCANLIGRDGTSWVPSYRIITKGGLRISVTGFLDSTVSSLVYRRSLGHLMIEDPVEAARRVLPEMKKKSDMTVALIHFNVMDVNKFLEAFPEIDVAVIGHASGDGTPERIAGTIAVAGEDLGKSLGELSLTVIRGKGVVNFRGALVPVSEDIPLDEKAQNEVTRFYQTVREERLSEDLSFLPAAPGDAGYAGAKQCAGCHPLNFRTWSATPHAFAFETLKNKKSEFDPECVVCHVVGYRTPSGFLGESKTPHLSGVQCESCHGPGGAHLDGEPIPSKVSEDRCRTCHNEIHSPAFDFPLYLERSNPCSAHGL